MYCGAAYLPPAFNRSDREEKRRACLADTVSQVATAAPSRTLKEKALIDVASVVEEAKQDLRLLCATMLAARP